jgi:hypothetical protein
MVKRQLYISLFVLVVLGIMGLYHSVRGDNLGKGTFRMYPSLRVPTSNPMMYSSDPSLVIVIAVQAALRRYVLVWVKSSKRAGLAWILSSKRAELALIQSEQRLRKKHPHHYQLGHYSYTHQGHGMGVKLKSQRIKMIGGTHVLLQRMGTSGHRPMEVINR